MHEELTSRERQVAELVAEGLTSAEVGRILGVSPRTIEFHRRRVVSKLNTNEAIAALTSRIDKLERRVEELAAQIKRQHP